MGDYTRLATLIGSHEELALFRRFAFLNAKNLLYMQSELVHLEGELANIALEDDRSGDDDKALFQGSLFDLKESAGTEKGAAPAHSGKRANAAITSSQDNALLQYSQIRKFEKPLNKDLKLLQEWLDRPEGGDFFLRGREAEIWENEKDLIALSDRQAKKDSITRFISDTVIPWYHHRWGHRFKNTATSGEDWNGLWHYEEASFVAVANAISTILSSLLPTTSILVLYFVKSSTARVAVTMLFTTLFSLTLATVARAKKTEAFAATTA
ncbi:MAG: hypothetical protein Q9187_002954 [Circinaria calcarea]